MPDAKGKLLASVDAVRKMREAAQAAAAQIQTEQEKPPVPGPSMNKSQESAKTRP